MENSNKVIKFTKTEPNAYLSDVILQNGKKYLISHISDEGVGYKLEIKIKSSEITELRGEYQIIGMNLFGEGGRNEF